MTGCGECDWKRRPREWQALGRGLEEGRGYSQETRKAIRCSDDRQKRFPARRTVPTDREDRDVGAHIDAGPLHSCRGSHGVEGGRVARKGVTLRKNIEE